MTIPEHSKPKCPNCRQNLRELEENGICYLGCLKCFGLFISPEDLRKYVNASQMSSELTFDHVLKIDALNKVDVYNPNRTCPICSSMLDQYQYCFNSGIKIDGCPKHHGVFFDIGELSRAKEFVSSGKERPTRSENALLRRYEAVIGQPNGETGDIRTKSEVTLAFSDLARQVWQKFRGSNESGE